MTDPLILIMREAFGNSFLGDDRGESAVFTPAGGDPETCTVRVIPQENPIPSFTGADIPSTIIYIYWQIGSITQPKKGDTFKVDSVTYTIEDHENHGAYGRAIVI